MPNNEWLEAIILDKQRIEFCATHHDKVVRLSRTACSHFGIEYPKSVSVYCLQNTYYIHYTTNSFMSILGFYPSKTIRLKTFQSFEDFKLFMTTSSYFEVIE